MMLRLRIREWLEMIADIPLYLALLVSDVHERALGHQQAISVVERVKWWLRDAVAIVPVLFPAIVFLACKQGNCGQKVCGQEKCHVCFCGWMIRRVEWTLEVLLLAPAAVLTLFFGRSPVDL